MPCAFSLFTLKLPEGDEPSFSPVFILENAKRVSGKLGGVAGVLHGVQIWKQKEYISTNLKDLKKYMS